MQTFLKFLLIVCVTAGAVYVGYRFLSIRADFLFAAPEEVQENLEPVLTVETLPDETIGGEAQAPAPDAMSEQEVILARVVDYFRINGSEVMDSRYFTDKAACDAAVRTVSQEYLRRGVPQQNMTETAPYVGSTGVVMMFTNQNVLHYIGCMAPDGENWAVYVQYRPKA